MTPIHAQRIDGAVMARAVSPVMGVGLRPILPVPVVVAAPPNLPVAGSRNGSLFTDRFDPNLHWYLPDFAPAADIDPAFAFTVSQTGQQANGQPFSVAYLSLKLSKQQPAQAAQFAQANPAASLREIPLGSLTAQLSSTYIDQNGNAQQRSFSAASLTAQADGSYLAVFNGSILGDSVLAVYQDLRAFGKATITVNATFQCWSLPQPMRQIFVRNTLIMAPVQRQVAPGLPFRPPAMPLHPAGPPAPAPAPPSWVEIALNFSTALPLGLKYNAAGYQLRYTVSSATSPSHVILGAGDLSGFSQAQTQFAEFNELGDLSLKYPTLSRAYVGALSKTIVIIAQRYTIRRGKSGCSATCLARVDSSAASASQCAFDFDFIIAPAVSPIELAKLGAEIASHPDLSGYQLSFPDFLQTNPASSVLTAFASSVQFAAGGDRHTFALTITVQDAGATAPAVANANLLITQLSAQTGTDLIGSLSLMLDSGYPTPVLATIDLNFAHTAGSDEILAQIDSGTNTINVKNQSPLDLQMQNYALIDGATVTETADAMVIAAGAGVSLPLPAAAGGLSFALSFACEAQLALPTSMNAEAITKFLNFQTVDVQSTQYAVALDASGVDFTKIASLACAVTFPSLPALAPWQTTLTATLKSDTKHVQIPIENAVFTLPGTIALTVTWVAPSTAATTLTLENDFTANPVMVLLQSQLNIPAPPPPPAAGS